MLITSDTPRAASRNFRAIFYQDLARSAEDMAWWRDLFFVIQSDSPDETISFLRGVPRMREWLGDRKIRNLAEASFRITKKDWESTISVLRDQIIYDRLNQVRPAIRSLATSFPLHYVDHAIDLMLLGFTKTGYDGQFFFDTDHDNGGGTTYSNMTSAAFSSTEWDTARARPAQLKDIESGRYLSIRWTHIFYGVNAEAAVRSVFGVSDLAGGGTNPNFNNIPPERRIMLPELGATGKWFLFDLSKPVKPFMLLINKGVDFVGLDRPEDWNVFNKKEFIYGIDSIDNAGYMLHELAYGSNVA